MKRPETHYADNDGVSIAYQVFGDGPAELVIVPGFVSNVEIAWGSPLFVRLYERLSQSVPVEIINWRVTSSGPAPQVRLQVVENEQKVAQTARKGSRKAYFPESGGYHVVSVYDRYALLLGTSFAGPAIVEERESTVIVGPDCHFRIDEQRNLIVEL